MLWTGFDQHYGGLEATRRYIYSQPGWENLAPEHLKRIGSDRIFATLLYPNALAGVLLLLSPAMLAVVWLFTSRLNRLLRAVITGLLAYACVACLVWSGSKAGWLIALMLGLVCLLQMRFPRRVKVFLIVVVATGGLAGFFATFSGYFARGATSVGARMEYWRAAWKTALRHPLLGAGPGTFSVSYRKLKPPGAEMAQLAHNDYLEQACDSGFPGALAYGVFVAGSVAGLYRRCRRDLLRLAVWLGLLGWALQSFVEFGLYIPAVGWTAFWLLGWLWGANQFDKSGSPG
jgi:O-antigen ligase